jgi:biopolymer transport protein TolQ
MLDLIFGAGFVVQAVLLLLLVLSVGSWAAIWYKAREYRVAEADSRVLLEAYHERPFEVVYDVAKEYDGSPLATLFRAGYREVAQLRRAARGEGGATPEQVESVVQRLAWAESDETHRLTRGLPFLATIGSAAPFIGLFGTVVGIMNAFRDIGVTGSASLAVVAPGIAEALVATAVGLFAAIPAVVGFNYLNARCERLLERLSTFRVELAQSLRHLTERAA